MFIQGIDNAPQQEGDGLLPSKRRRFNVDYVALQKKLQVWFSFSGSFSPLSDFEKLTFVVRSFAIVAFSLNDCLLRSKRAVHAF